MAPTALSPLQLDVLDLESQTWKLPGSKMSEFRRRHPRVTETGYYVALLRLISNPAAYEYAGQRYAPMLNRMAERQQEELARRTGLRGTPRS